MCLQKVLGALLKSATVASTKVKMSMIGAQAIDSCEREGKSLADFAGDLDKALLFAEWQTKIFTQDQGLLAEALAVLGRKVFSHFQSHLKMVESAQFYYLDAEDADAFRKVLTKLRASVSVTHPTVPTLPVKAKGKVKPKDGCSYEDVR